jgi:DNA-directed RNA polymerase I, II, and III subunit RPABC2
MSTENDQYYGDVYGDGMNVEDFDADENDDLLSEDDNSQNNEEKNILNDSYLENNDMEGDENDDDDDEDEYEDEDEEQQENYLQKLNKQMESSIISDYHPELKFHNYEEVEILSKVVRDANGDIIDPLHRTLPFITKYEKARILGERAKQINSGAKPLVQLSENMIDGYLIALKEYEERKIPFILKRPLPNGAMEYWKFNDLEIIS